MDGEGVRLVLGFVEKSITREAVLEDIGNLIYAPGSILSKWEYQRRGIIDEKKIGDIYVTRQD